MSILTKIKLPFYYYFLLFIAGATVAFHPLSLLSTLAKLGYISIDASSDIVIANGILTEPLFIYTEFLFAAFITTTVMYLLVIDYNKKPAKLGSILAATFLRVFIAFLATVLLPFGGFLGFFILIIFFYRTIVKKIIPESKAEIPLFPSAFLMAVAYFLSYVTGLVPFPKDHIDSISKLITEFLTASILPFRSILILCIPFLYIYSFKKVLTADTATSPIEYKVLFMFSFVILLLISILIPGAFGHMLFSSIFSVAFIGRMFFPHGF